MILLTCCSLIGPLLLVDYVMAVVAVVVAAVVVM